MPTVPMNCQSGPKQLRSSAEKGESLADAASLAHAGDSQRASQIDAYMREGSVPHHLEDPISLEPLRAPVRVSPGGPAYSQHSIHRWLDLAVCPRDPMTRQLVGDKSIRRDERLAGELDQLRSAAEKKWRAEGDITRAWATRWLRLHCRRLESRPPFRVQSFSDLVAAQQRQEHHRLLLDFQERLERVRLDNAARLTRALRLLSTARGFCVFSITFASAASGLHEAYFLGLGLSVPSSVVMSLSSAFAGRQMVFWACSTPGQNRGRAGAGIFCLVLVNLMAHSLARSPSSQATRAAALSVFAPLSCAASCLAGIAVGVIDYYRGKIGWRLNVPAFAHNR